jgi:hypothetical protein
MIGAGHIAQPGAEPNYCPSIASVVATDDPFGSHYLGSVRLQTHLIYPIADGYSCREAGGRVRKAIAHDLLFDMMKERFGTWGGYPPTRPFFVRDSLSHGDDDAAKRKCETIKKAYEVVYPNEFPVFKLTYVVVKHILTEASSGNTAPFQSHFLVPPFEYTAEV